MKSTTLTLILSCAFLVLVSMESCLKPYTGGSGTKAFDFDRKCEKPSTSLPIMHTRRDVTWPTPACRARAATLLGKMTLEEKIGQMVQPDRGQLKRDDDIVTFGLGSVLNGGSSDPPSNSALGWWKMVRQLQAISLQSRLKIPILYGVDAVHGHNNVRDAVIFPHNIGLGCTRNPELVRRVGRITAIEMAATGIDWTFAPVLAASRDERWGRAYEAFGETPALAAELGKAMILGLQGERLGQTKPSVLACAKHFAGDGGTKAGVDQGNTLGSDEEIQRLHVAQYKAAIEANVGSIMVSFSSVNGTMMHCNGRLLTDVLKGQLNFNGFLISDWEAVEQTPGSYRTQVANAINAGLDMVMAPVSYLGFIRTLSRLVPKKVPLSRIDDAVGRILSVKCELGMLDTDYYPRDQQGNIRLDSDLINKVGSIEHRIVAREAVRQSLVLLKNENNLLPLSKALSHIHVAGKNADDLGNQCGGWSIDWQGCGGPLTKGTTILQAIKKEVTPGTNVTYSMTGAQANGAEVGIVVVGETPYAEGSGDRADLSLEPQDLSAIQTIKSTGIPVVVILVSGRPMVLGPALESADALIAAWLPGTEGQGVSDIIFGNYRPTGKLSVSWPRSMEQILTNVGDKDYNPQFPYGFGLTYDKPGILEVMR